MTREQAETMARAEFVLRRISEGDNRALANAKDASREAAECLHMAGYDLADEGE